MTDIAKLTISSISGRRKRRKIRNRTLFMRGNYSGSNLARDYRRWLIVSEMSKMTDTKFAMSAPPESDTI